MEPQIDKSKINNLEGTIINKPRARGVKRLYNATLYSWAGLKATFKTEAAFRQESVAFLLLTPLALIVGDNALEWILLIGSLLLVLMMELVNSAIEAVVDRISSEYHPLSGRAKDIGSAVVFMALIFAVFTWGMVIFS